MRRRKGASESEEDKRSIRVFLVENFFSLAIDVWHRNPGAVQILGEKCHEDNCPGMEAISEQQVSTWEVDSLTTIYRIGDSK